MATRIETIITRARDTLADPDAERWSDARLVRLVDEAQKDIAKHAKILKADYTWVLELDVHTYTLPDNVWLITRASTEDYEIRMLSYDLMDENSRKLQLSRSYEDYQRERNYGYGNNNFPGRRVWETETSGTVEYLIYDNRNINQIRVFPIPNEEILESTYTFENSGTPAFVGDELYGCVTAIEGPPDYTLDSVFGCTTSLFDPSIQVETIDTFGVVTSIQESKKSVTIWYIRIPDQITSLTDDLETPQMFDVAIKHYIISHALRDDLDVQQRHMAAESMTLYNRELELIQETNRTDGTRNAVTYETTYRGGFE